MLFSSLTRTPFSYTSEMKIKVGALSHADSCLGVFSCGCIQYQQRELFVCRTRNRKRTTTKTPHQHSFHFTSSIKCTHQWGFCLYSHHILIKYFMRHQYPTIVVLIFLDILLLIKGMKFAIKICNKARRAMQSITTVIETRAFSCNLREQKAHLNGTKPLQLSLCAFFSL